MRLEQQHFTIGTGRTKVTLTAENGGVSVADIGPFQCDGKTAIWELTTRNADGDLSVLDSSALEVASVDATDRRIDVTWQGDHTDGSMTVRASVTCDGGTPQWSLSVTPPAGWSVDNVAFPRVSLSVLPDMKLAVPTCWGLEKPVAPGLKFDETYPSWGAVMQFMAAYAGTEGIYYATHDPNANHKAFRASADEIILTLECAHYPAIAEGEYAIPYVVSLGSFEGGYMAAASLYREFALSTPWTAAGPVSKRAIPKWLVDTEVWLKPGETPWTDDDEECITATKANVELCRRAKIELDVPISLHWYRWHKIPYDTLYPEYFPPKQGFVEGVKEAQEAGFRVMPYINGRLCDPESDSWKRFLHASAARDENGESYTEVYGSKVPLSPMCPSTPDWQTTVQSLVKRLITEVGVDGVYIDQITCAKAERCFDPRHPHAPGGGGHWAHGYRELLHAVRKQLPEDGMLTSEECMECWMDLIDAHLVLNSPCGEGEMIPLFPAVYSGYTITFGFQYFPPGEPVHSLGFRSKVARAFLWGSQLGWIDAARVMEEDADTDREFLRNLAHARSGAHDFLQFGQLLGPITLSGDNPRLTAEAPGSFGGTYNLDLPAVMATLWRSEDGRTAVAICNMDDSDHCVSINGSEVAIGAREARIVAR